MKVTISKSMIEVVIAEYEAANPGKTFLEMSSAEFADLMMKKIIIEGDLPSPEATEHE